MPNVKQHTAHLKAGKAGRTSSKTITVKSCNRKKSKKK